MAAGKTEIKQKNRSQNIHYYFVTSRHFGPLCFGRFFPEKFRTFPDHAVKILKKESASY